jgi:hypothetical protein
VEAAFEDFGEWCPHPEAGGENGPQKVKMLTDRDTLRHFEGVKSKWGNLLVTEGENT